MFLNIFNLGDIYLLLSWGFLVDISLAILKVKRARSLNDNYRIWHGSIMIAVLALSALAFIYSYQNGNSTDFILNSIVLGATILNVIGGLSMYIITRISYFSTRLSYVKVVHKYTGYFFWIVSKGVMIYLITPFLGIYFGLIVCTQVYLHYQMKDEINLKYYKPSESKKDSNLTVNNSDMYSSLLTDINCGKNRHEINAKYPGIKWVIFGNRVCDLTNFIHPGGNLIIDKVIGREISRYIYGGHKAEKLDIQPHAHSVKALRLLNEFHIGDLYGFESILLCESTERESQQKSFRDLELSLSSEHRVSGLPLLRKFREEHLSTFDDEWKLHSKGKLGNKLGSFEFKNDYFRVKAYCQSLSGYGRSVLLRRKENYNQVRTYTIAQSMTQTAKFLLEDLEKHFECLVEQRSSNAEIKLPRENDTLTLFIKDFESSDGLSKKIHNAKEGDLFVIEGPMGRGLNITADTKGELYFICGGTGILAFVDFLYFYLMKMMHDIIKERYPGVSSKFQDLKLNFNVLGSVKIHLIEVFTGLQDSYGNYLINKLVKLNNTFDRNRFDCQKIISNNENKLNEEYLAKNITIKPENQYYVCGPPTFNEEIPNILVKLGASEDSIHLV